MVNVTKAVVMGSCRDSKTLV